MGHKTLLIIGTAKVIDSKVHYNLSLYGQSNEDKKMVFIRDVKPIVNCYASMIEFCKEVYASYFNTDLFNIITLDNLVIQSN